MTGIHAFIAVFILGAAIDAGLPADALGEFYGAADAAVEELESERGPEDEGVVWLRAELRHLEAKMPRDVSGLEMFLADVRRRLGALDARRAVEAAEGRRILDTLAQEPRS